MGSASLENLIIAAGVVHFCIVGVAIYVPRMLNWQRSLAPLDPFMRKLVWVYALFIGITVAGFGVLSVLRSAELAAGTPLSRAVCAFIAVFWMVRTVIQFLVFKRPAFVRGWFRTVGYHALSAAIVLLTLTYGFAALG